MCLKADIFSYKITNYYFQSRVATCQEAHNKSTSKQLLTCQFLTYLHLNQSLGMDVRPDQHLQNILPICKFEISHVLPNTGHETERKTRSFWPNRYEKLPDKARCLKHLVVPKIYLNLVGKFCALWATIVQRI